MASDPIDVRPQVARKSGAAAPWIMGGVLLLGGVALFLTLDANRRAITAPATRAPATAQDRAGSTIPELNVPEPLLPDEPLSYRLNQPGLQPVQPVPAAPAAVPAPRPPQFGPQTNHRGWDRLGGPPEPQESWPSPASGIVYEAPRPLPTAAAASADPNSPTSGPERVEAGRLLHPGQTVTQGSVIQGVLETALDTTRTGLARAIVSHDVRGFDGEQVLIPRGSRLIGEYQSDVTAGQNRALIRWTRLIRPDGVTIAIQSPSADTLGRAGVRGKVHTHFLERYSGAILQSALDVGVGLATRSVTNGAVILGWPGGAGGSGARTATGSDIRATVTVRQGASISVFVARDLDFTSASIER